MKSNHKEHSSKSPAFAVKTFVSEKPVVTKFFTAEAADKYADAVGGKLLGVSLFGRKLLEALKAAA